MTEIDDFLSFELFKNAVFSIADEMAVTICRTTYSSVLRDNMDFSTGIADADGRLVAQGLTLPFHLGSIQTALGAVVAQYGADMHDGDVYVLNDPFNGGMHLPDIFLFKPIFVAGERVAFAATTAHHVDVGGRVPGSNAADSTEIYQEGLRIPPLKLVDCGRPNVTLHAMIEQNVRLPVQVFGDLRAQQSACEMAETEFAALVGRFGLDMVKRYMQEAMDYTERLTRAAVRALPDGVYDFEDWIDDDGVDFDRPIRLFLTIRKQGEDVEFDWTGSAEQVRGAINSTLSVTEAASYTALRSVLPDTIPNNDGVFRVIRVTAPPGTVANVAPPGACAARALTGFRMVDCAFGALAKMVPDRVFAASDGGNVGLSLGGTRDDGRPFVYVDFACGTWGGRPWADGLEGNSNIFVNMASQSAEMIESEFPVEVLAYELAQDGCGAGQYRGGAPFYRDYRLGEGRAVLQIRADRQAIRPYGLYGGKAGQPGACYLGSQAIGQRLRSKVTMEIKGGDAFGYRLPGGGGWGDPLDRKPALVLRDARNGIISVAAARDRYGVVIDPDTWRVDEPATDNLRADRRDDDAKPFVTWDDG